MKSTEACRRGTHNDRGIRKARDNKWEGAEPIDVVRILRRARTKRGENPLSN